MRLNAIARKIIVERLYDKGIYINESDLVDYIVDDSLYEDLNSMYNDIVDNYGKLIIR